MANTALLETAAPAAPDIDTQAVRRLADSLLAEHGDAGASVAALVEADAAAWEAARPWVAMLVAEGIHSVRQLSGPGEPDSSPLAATDAVPSVVWARQLGVVQRQLGRAVRGLGGDSTPEEQAAVLREALRRIGTVATALRAATLAV